MFKGVINEKIVRAVIRNYCSSDFDRRLGYRKAQMYTCQDNLKSIHTSVTQEECI